MKAAKRKIFGLCVLFSIFNLTYGQKEDNIWLLGGQNSGNNMKIDFSTGNPDTSGIFSLMRFFTTDNSICDSTGRLLFYTNGIKIFNKNYDSLYNFVGFNPGWATNYYAQVGMGITQSMVIINEPGTPKKYLLFHESAEQLQNGETQPLNLSYSEVDMNLDSGLGGMTTKKNIHIIDDTLIIGKVTACRHANGRDWWIIAHKYNTSVYYKILVTPDTIITTSQQIGSIIPFNYDIGGQICFSSNGEKLVYAIQNNKIDVFNFDRCSGILDSVETISLLDTNNGVAGCSISPSSQYLYVNNNINVYQYDLNASNINSTQYIVATWDSFYDFLPTYYYLNQLAINNKIYISTFDGTSYLHVIDDPDQQGSACNFIQHGLKLPTYNIGLPNFPNYRLGALTGSTCDTLHIGIDEIAHKKKRIKVFPNPASTTVNLIYNLSGYNKGEIFIYNSIGVMIEDVVLNIDQSNQEINISMFANGIYNCILKGDNKKLDEFKLSISR